MVTDYSILVTRRPVSRAIFGISLFAVTVLGLFWTLPMYAQVSTPSAVGTVATNSETTGTQIASAMRMIEAHKLPEAELAARAYLHDHPSSGEGHFLLGFILFREDKAKESLGEYTTGARSKVPSPSDLKVVGLDYVLIDDYVDAQKWLTRSTEGNPADATAWYSLGRVQYKLNVFVEAANSFERSLSLDPRNVKAEDNLGLTLAALGRSSEAMAAYRQAIAWQSGSEHPSEQPLLNLGSILLEHEEIAEATALLERAVAIAPNDPKIHEQLGRAYLLQNNLTTATQHLERAVALSPDDSRLHYQLGKIYQKQHMTAKAKIEFARTETLNGSRSTPP